MPPYLTPSTHLSHHTLTHARTPRRPSAAFLALPAPVVAWLTNARSTNRDALTATLTYHVLGAAVGSSAVRACVRALCFWEAFRS